MRFGFYKFAKESDSTSESRNYGKGSAGFESDIARLSLFAFMLLAAIIGGYISKSTNEPSNAVKRSINRTLQQSFRVGMEGYVSFRDNELESYRNHYQYNPDNGLSLISDEGSTGQPAVDPLSGLELILQSENITENEMEDMYGHGTQYFSGGLNFNGDDESVGGIFNYWIDMKTHMAVRLEIIKVERDITTPDNPEPASKETYINIRYYGFR